MDELTKKLNLVTHVLDQSAAEHRDAEEQTKAQADAKLAASFGEAASSIGTIMKRIERREKMNQIVEWVREHGTVTHESRDLMCGRVGEAKIRYFPFGSEVNDETPWVGVRGPNDTGRLTPAYYNFGDFKKAVEKINGGEANAG